MSPYPYYSPRNFSPSDIFPTITFASLTVTFLADGCAFKWSSKHGTLIISLLLLSPFSLPLFFSFFFFLPELPGAVEAANDHACRLSRFLFLQLVGFHVDNEKTMLRAILRHPFGCGYGCVWCLISAYLYLRSSHLSMGVYLPGVLSIQL